MRRNIVLYAILGGALVLASGIVVACSLAGSRAAYQPGRLASRAEPGSLSLDPPGSLVYGEGRPAGAGLPGTVEPFRVEVEKGIVLEGFTRGEGRPVLVIHGGPGFAGDEPWAGLEPFVKSHRFYYWHQRGSGRSTRPIDRFAAPRDFPGNAARLEASLGLAQQVADIERLRRAIGAPSVDLVGHSFGGLLSCLAALEFPGRVGKLLLVAPAPLVIFPSATGGLYEEIRRSLPASELAAYNAWLKDFFDYGKLFGRSEAELARLNAGMFPFYAKAMESRSPGGGELRPTDPALIGGWMMQAVFFSMGRRHDWSKDFASIAAPATLVYGERDLSEAGAFDQYRSIPGIRIISAGEADHFLMDDPARFGEAARDFFE